MDAKERQDEKTPFERLIEFTKKVIQVPKDELAKPAAKRRPRKRLRHPSG